MGERADGAGSFSDFTSCQQLRCERSGNSRQTGSSAATAARLSKLGRLAFSPFYIFICTNFNTNYPLALFPSLKPADPARIPGAKTELISNIHRKER